MLRKRLLAVLVFGICLQFANAVYADSDGYYCIGRDYIAYQFGFASPPIGPHRLFVVRFGRASGIEAPAVLDLPQFQVHGMLCDEGGVRLSAYDAIYTVQLDSRRRPIRYETTQWVDHQNTPSIFVGHSLNLGAWARSSPDRGIQRDALGESDGGGHYFLEIRVQTIEPATCARTVQTRLVRTGRNGREVQQFEIFTGKAAAGCERGD